MGEWSLKRGRFIKSFFCVVNLVWSKEVIEIGDEVDIVVVVY